MAPLLIINADDFGHDDDTVRTTINCFETELISSASIMPRMPASAAAINFAKGQPELGFGVHLTLAGEAGETPITNPDVLSTLTASNGRLYSPKVFRVRCALGMVSTAQIVREIEAQVGFVSDHGVRLSHVDSHHHLHKLEAVQAALSIVLPRFGITRVRTAQNVFVRPSPLRASYWLGVRTGMQLAQRFLTTERFFMFDYGAAPALSVFSSLLDLDGSLEFGVHPGWAESWRRQEFDSLRALVKVCHSKGRMPQSWHQLCKSTNPPRRRVLLRSKA